MADSDDTDRRIMNDSTMPLPRKNKPATAAATTAAVEPKPVATAAAAAVVKKNPRQKKSTAATRFGLSEWNRLLRSSKDLAQLRGQSPHRKIRLAEISKHNTVHDGWIALRGKVYYISPYMAYHPGGQSILKPVLGKDATAAFEKYHPWVNQDGLISKLQIGYLDTSRALKEEDDSSDDRDGPSYTIPVASTIKDADGFAIPAPKPKTKVAPPILAVKTDDKEDNDDGGGGGGVGANPWATHTSF